MTDIPTVVVGTVTEAMPETAVELGWVLAASALGAIINVLRSRKNNHGTKDRTLIRIDAALAGVTAFFAGVFLAPLLADSLDKYLPGAKEAGVVPLAAAASLFGAMLIEKIFALISPKKSEEDDKPEE